MLQSPKSLTATVHIRFHYYEPEGKPADESQVEMMNRILDHASELDPSLQELLISFANYLSELKNKEGEAEPG